MRRLQAQLQSSVPATGGPERNPPNSNAATWLQNAGLDIAAMPRATGGSDAKNDGDQLKLMFCAGVGIMAHYFGDPSTGNLATAEAMELPMLKEFTEYQELWKDAWRDIFAIVLDEDIDEEPAPISVNLPPMLKDDLSRLGQFLMGLHQVFPEIQVPEILEMCLIALGVNNIEEVMKKIEAKRKELAASQSTLGNQLPPPIILPKAKPGAAAPTIGAKGKQAVLTAESLHTIAHYTAVLQRLSEAIQAL